MLFHLNKVLEVEKLIHEERKHRTLVACEQGLLERGMREISGDDGIYQHLC